MSDAADPSPSNCNYCYSLECMVRVESTSSNVRKGAIQCKQAVITVGRSFNRKIVLQVEMRGGSARGGPAVASYPLVDCRIHQQASSQGKGSIEIPNKNMVIQMSNCAPRKLNVFMKTLQAKLDIMKADRVDAPRTPLAQSRANMLAGVPEVFNKLSPLTVGEIRRVRKMRGVDSPLAKRSVPPPNETAGASETTPRAVKRNALAADENTPKRKSLEVPKKSAPSERVQLSNEQRAVIRAVVSQGRNLFFTGSAGTGKSLILRRIIEMLPAATTFVTAATGVAACQLGGITLHSFAGIGVGGNPKEQCLKLVEAKKPLVKTWKACSHLIIDEISMVDAEYFTCLEYVARKIRRDDRPFGGIQLIITGDFLQLPPVVKKGQTVKFCFESPAWRFAVTSTILLKEVRRQNDNKFIEILQEIRVGRCPQWVVSALQATRANEIRQNGVIATRLCTHTSDADTINQHNLQKLSGTEKTFNAEDSHHIPDYLSGMVPRALMLKIDAQVMLTKNLDLSRGLSNGARGVVVGFAKTGFPLVKFLTNDELPVELRAVRFSIKLAGGEETALRRQLPLQLAWAISIHKSQGLTLDAVEMSLSRVFAEGQAYVALSRARSLASLRIVGFDSSCIHANEKVVRFYESLAENNDNGEEDIGSFIIRKRSRMSL